MVTKRKPRNQFKKTPPLSAVDKCIYWTARIMVVVVYLLYIFGFNAIRKKIAFNNPNVIAYIPKKTEFLTVIFPIYLLFSSIILFAEKDYQLYPLFGNPEIEYGKNPWPDDVFPLLDKKYKHIRSTVYKRKGINTRYRRFNPTRANVTVFRIYTKQSERKPHFKWFYVWLLGFIISLSLLPFGICGRYCLLNDDSITSYDVMNRETNESYLLSDSTNLKLRIGHGRGWFYTIKIVMTDGNLFSFDGSRFKGGHLACLKKAIEMKKQYSPETISIEGVEDPMDLERLIHYLRFTDEEAQLIKELFEVN